MGHISDLSILREIFYNYLKFHVQLYTPRNSVVFLWSKVPIFLLSTASFEYIFSSSHLYLELSEIRSRRRWYRGIIWSHLFQLYLEKPFWGNGTLISFKIQFFFVTLSNNAEKCLWIRFVCTSVYLSVCSSLCVYPKSRKYSSYITKFIHGI